MDFPGALINCQLWITKRLQNGFEVQILQQTSIDNRKSIKVKNQVICCLKVVNIFFLKKCLDPISKKKVQFPSENDSREYSQEFLGYFWTALKKDIDTFKLVQAATTKNVKQSERHYPKKQLRGVTSTLLLSFYVTVGIAEVSQYLVATKGFEKNNQQFVIVSSFLWRAAIWLYFSLSLSSFFFLQRMAQKCTTLRVARARRLFSPVNQSKVQFF